MKKVIVIALLMMLVFSLSVIEMNHKDNTAIKTNVENGISNKKIGWGIKRNNNHEQPDVGTYNKKVLEENEGICLGNSEKKVIYLTFDQGYEAGYTPQLLEILKENQIKATFFLTAHYVNTQPDLVKQMINEGHIVGNHTPNALMS